MSTPRDTISFDLDGTLIHGPFGRVMRELDEQVAAEQDHQGTQADLLAIHERLLATDPVGAYDWETLTANYLDTHALRLPFDLLERLDAVVAERPVTLIHENTARHLEGLADAGWRLMLLTNGWRRYQVPALRGAGLLDVFDGIVASDDVGAAKPSPLNFHHVSPGEGRLVHVGDRLDHDVLGGNRAGAFTVLLRPDAPDADVGVEVEVDGGADGAGDAVAGAGREDVAQYLTRRAEAEGVTGSVPRDELCPDAVCSTLAAVVGVVEGL